MVTRKRQAYDFAHTLAGAKQIQKIMRENGYTGVIIRRGTYLTAKVYYVYGFPPRYGSRILGYLY